MMTLYSAINNFYRVVGVASTIVVVLVALLCVSCAQTVTDKDLKGEEVQFTLTFQAPIDTNHRYFIAVSALRHHKSI